MLKGTIVTIRTTNGGEITAPLVETYRRSYDAVVGIGPSGWAVITANRIKSISIATSDAWKAHEERGRERAAAEGRNEEETRK